jgi:hypothetical protein
MKAQWVRVADVVLVGPVMIVAARQVRGSLGTALAVFGWLTILYNGLNWWRIKEGLTDTVE